MASIDLQQLDASLKQRKTLAKDLMVKRLTEGWGKLNSFKKLSVIDRIVLGSLSTKSMMQPGGKGTFNPKNNALKMQARIAQVRPAKIDLLITEIERRELEANYFAEVAQTKRDPKTFLLADYVHQYTIEQAGVDTLEAVWIGELNPTGTNAADVVDGIVTLIDADIASDERPEELVLVHSESNFIITESNIRSEVKNLVHRYRTKLPAYGFQPSKFYLAPERLAEYCFAVEEEFKNANHMIYNKFDQPYVHFAPNIIFEPVQALAGTDFMMIEPDDNLVFCTDRTGDKIELESDYNVRDRSIGMVADWDFAPNYYRSDIGVCNDLRVRPVTPPAPPVTPGDDEEGGA